MLRINNKKAARIAQERIRAWRDSAFANNDIRIQNALVDGDEQVKADAVAYRDYLRDLPQQCEGKAIEELKVLMSEMLSFQEYVQGRGNGE